ncbi:nuclear transport factor 2 protein(NFT2) [Perkinsela sp. CCAP 1560/4]|nr:nuclear transport factor 2 protein(NFT2) [Perkinsela sp. CCAP 1560/4]|eukprot:KNH07720.1 nuclear transport factor 2 protein(NFT2) [Perkinsela sp. CCAP 1560/4]
MNMNAIRENQAKVSMKAKEFAAKFYKLIDDTTPEERMRKLALLYVEDGSVIYWNGHDSASAGGPHKLLRLVLALMPPTKHFISAIDAQALPGCEEADFFMVAISGKCSYNQEVSRSFFQTLIVRQYEEKHYILEDDFRWTAEH